MYVCGCSSNRIVHNDTCRYVRMIPKRNRTFFYSLHPAFENGYRPCKVCSDLMRRLMREQAEMEVFCRKNSLHYKIDYPTKTVDVISESGRWKIVLEGKSLTPTLYHKDTYCGKQDRASEIPGYHYQNVRKQTIVGCLKYISGHDTYQSEQPLSKKQQKEFAKIQKKKRGKYMERVMHGREARHVLELLDFYA